MTILSHILSLLFACFLSSPQPFHDYQGLGRTAVVDALPAADTVRAIHGAEFHVGVIDNQADWDPIAAALSVDGAIDWSTQAVAYVILAEHTNALNLKGVTVDAKGRATVNVEWIGIEPFYPDHVPMVFTVIDRGQAAGIDFAIR